MFKIPPNESKVVWRLFTYSLTIATSYIVARTVGDSLFLSRVGNEQLALVFVLAGTCTAVVAAGWYFATRYLSISKTIQISGMTFALLSVVSWLLLPTFHHSFWLLAAIYLLAEVKGCINAINIVSALNTKLGRDASKPAWAAIGLAAPIAAVFAGGVFALEFDLLSLRAWLLVSAGLDVLTFVIGITIGSTKAVKTHTVQNRLTVEHRNLPSKTKRVYVSSSKFRFWIGALISAKMITLTIVAFEWKSSVNTFFDGDSESLVRFFGAFYGFVGLATIGCQLLLTSRLLVRRNLSLPILFMPFVLLGVAVCFAVGSGLVLLIASTLGKSLEVWRRSVHDTTLNLLYTKIRRENRRSAISLNSGLVKPMSEVLAASVIFLGASTVYQPLFLATLLLWILAAVRLIRLVKSPRLRVRHSDSSAVPNLGAEVWSSNAFQA